jgi:hypothetical protein
LYQKSRWEQATDRRDQGGEGGLPVDRADEDAMTAELMALFRQVPPDRKEAALLMLRSLAE